MQTLDKVEAGLRFVCLLMRILSYGCYTMACHVWREYELAGHPLMGGSIFFWIE